VVSIVIVPLLAVFYGWDLAAMASGAHPIWDFVVQVVLPAVAVILFWHYKGATPGKMLIAAKVVDAQTGGAPSTRQAILRYVGYFVSIFTLGIGFAWIGIDRRKQGFHDKIAGTLVIQHKEQK